MIQAFSLREALVHCTILHGAAVRLADPEATPEERYDLREIARTAARDLEAALRRCTS